MDTISQIRTKKVFFSIRWKILIAFLLILGVSFYVVATSLINLVGDSLYSARVNAELADVQELATRFAPMFARADADTLYQEALKSGREMGGRLLLIDMDGKVQVDTFSVFNGIRFGHPEVVSVLNGAAADHGLHRVQLAEKTVTEPIARFDFLRNMEIDKLWAGYFSAAMETEADGRVGLVLYSVGVQDLTENLRVMQDEMIFYFFLAAAAVLAMCAVFTRVITKPIAALTEGIKRMARGDLSGRVKVKGIDEMARLGETFNQMSEKLENLDTSRNEFVSNASHELKTPLATMKIMLESMMYQEDMDPALRAEFMGDINKELDRLSQIVTDLLTLVQTDAHDYSLRRKEFDLAVEIEETLHRLELLAHDRGQAIERKLQQNIKIYADSLKIRQVVYNLVENALKYSPSGSKVRVTLRQEGRRAVIEVADKGQGIPKKDQAHIFDRFYRVDKARSRETGGNGLGLSIVHQAVMMHEGTVTVYSEEGKGSTFRVELPL